MSALLGLHHCIVRHLPADLPRTLEIMVDWRVLTFTSLLSVVTGIVFGLLPFLQSRRITPNDSLKEGGRGIATNQSRLRSALLSWDKWRLRWFS